MLKKKNKKVSSKSAKLSGSELILIALKKMANAPFEILLEYGKIKKQLRPSSARIAVQRLRKKALVFAERRGSKLIFELTAAGEMAVEKIQVHLKKTKPKSWDGKWRIIIFDIPEKLRGKRDLLRRELVGFGFRQLQQSVWVYPYPLPEAFRDFWKEADIFKYCVIFEADKMENGESLERFFFGK